jgi:hypothetical protein
MLSRYRPDRTWIGDFLSHTGPEASHGSFRSFKTIETLLAKVERLQNDISPSSLPLVPLSVRSGVLLTLVRWTDVGRR